jgi:hypothetical protein
LHYQYRKTIYRITVLQICAEDGATGVTVDGVERHDEAIHLVDDRQEHYAEVRIHAAPVNTE